MTEINGRVLFGLCANKLKRRVREMAENKEVALPLGKQAVHYAFRSSYVRKYNDDNRRPGQERRTPLPDMTKDELGLEAALYSRLVRQGTPMKY